MLTRLAVVLAAGLLAGCSLPPAVTVASFAMDGFSYLVSGKSVSDHALSAVAKRDCAVFRAVQGDPVCRSAKTTAVAEAADRAGREGEGLSGIAPAVGGSGASGRATGATSVAALPPAASGRQSASPSRAFPGGSDGGVIVDGPGRETLVGGPGDDFYLFRLASPDSGRMVDTVGNNVAELDCDGRSIELFAMPTENGDLEVYAYDDQATGEDRLRLAFTVLDYARNPRAFAGVLVNGSFHFTEDILV